MPKYSVKAYFDMGMSEGSETHRFHAKNDQAAKAYLRRHTGKDLGDTKRGASFDKSTLSRAVGS